VFVEEISEVGLQGFLDGIGDTDSAWDDHAVRLAAAR
jgi:hypothetical protein